MVTSYAYNKKHDNIIIMSELKKGESSINKKKRRNPYVPEKRELTENNVLSIEEYLNKRKARRDKQETDMPEELIPFEVYLSSSLSWS